MDVVREAHRTFALKTANEHTRAAARRLNEAQDRLDTLPRWRVFAQRRAHGDFVAAASAYLDGVAEQNQALRRLTEDPQVPARPTPPNPKPPSTKRRRP
jgi:hypothetical protein